MRGEKAYAAFARGLTHLAPQTHGGLRVVAGACGQFQPDRGKNFYKIVGGAPWAASVSVETFPKQDSLEGKKLGNLLRMPLGRNQKSPDPCFFVDQRAAQTHLDPVEDPLSVLLARSAY